MDKTLDLSVSNYGTAKDLNYDIALLPWGATEPHGLHLPYMTDAILSHDLAVDAAKLALDRHGLRAMVMPPVTMGSQNPGQRGLKFCVHARYETQKAILTDIVASLYCQGMRRLWIINGHGGNNFKNMIRDLAVDYPDMLIATSEWFGPVSSRDYFDNPGDHADEIETSVMMHYHPELVNIADACDGRAGGFASEALAKGQAWLPRDWSRISADTGVGDPRLATPKKGERYARACASALADILRDLCAPDLYKPLDNSSQYGLHIR